MKKAFTLLELLTVIAILGILAAIAVPAFKNFGAADASISGARQMLDDVARARQLAMSQRTTVYLVFVSTNFWIVNGAFPNPWWNSLSTLQQNVITNLVSLQLTGYAMLSLRTVGDQPGQHFPKYLSQWKSLPDGIYIPSFKFDPGSNRIAGFMVTRFNYSSSFPVPTADAQRPANNVSLPYVAFNYLGQLTVDGINPADVDEFIPLARGAVFASRDTEKIPLVDTRPPQVSEIPPGNSTNSYNLVHIDHLTGRARLEFQKVK